MLPLLGQGERGLGLVYVLDGLAGGGARRRRRDEHGLWLRLLLLRRRLLLLLLLVKLGLLGRLLVQWERGRGIKRLLLLRLLLRWWWLLLLLRRRHLKVRRLFLLWLLWLHRPRRRGFRGRPAQPRVLRKPLLVLLLLWWWLAEGGARKVDLEAPRVPPLPPGVDRLRRASGFLRVKVHKTVHKAALFGAVLVPAQPAPHAPVQLRKVSGKLFVLQPLGHMAYVKRMKLRVGSWRLLKLFGMLRQHDDMAAAAAVAAGLGALPRLRVVGLGSIGGFTKLLSPPPCPGRSTYVAFCFFCASSACLVILCLRFWCAESVVIDIYTTFLAIIEEFTVELLFSCSSVG